MKVLFIASGEFAIPSLELLLNEGMVYAVITQPDKPGKRGKKLIPTPVKEFALKKGVKVFQPQDINSNEVLEIIEKEGISLNIVVSYGGILKEKVLNAPEFGSINVHPSLLPKYRGASPIQNALLNGDRITGVSIIKMNERMDAGDIITQREIPVSLDDDFFSLSFKLSELGAELLIKVLKDFSKGEVSLTPQNEDDATYCKKIAKTDALIDWTKPCFHIFNMIRAFVKWPVCYSYHGKNLIKFYKAIPLEMDSTFSPSTAVRIDKRRFGIVCGDGKILEIKKVQLQGRKVLDVSDFLNGYDIKTGDIFLNEPHKN